MNKIIDRIHRFKLNNWDFRIALWRQRARYAWAWIFPLIVNNPPVVHLSAAGVVPTVVSVFLMPLYILVWLITSVWVWWWWCPWVAVSSIYWITGLTSFIYNWKKNSRA